MRLRDELLQFLSGMSEAMPRLFETKYAHIRRLRGYPKDYSEKSVRMALWRMEKDKLVKRRRGFKGVSSYVLTMEGEKALAKNFKLKKREDQFLTMIIFDIPEEKRRARDTFRRFMLKRGFHILQKSALVGPFQFSEECKGLVKNLGIGKYVAICSVKIDNFSFS